MQIEPRQTGLPTSPVQPTGFFTGVQARPVILGVVVDYIATYALIYGYVFLYLAKQFSQEGEAAGDAIAKYMSSNEGLMIGFALGTLGTLLGGLAAGLKAGSFEIKHGAFVGLGSLIVSFVEFSLQEEVTPVPEWFRFISVMAVIPAGALGGYFAEVVRGLRTTKPPTGGGWPGR